jgi:predicted HTH transcriptional regulator
VDDTVHRLAPVLAQEAPTAPGPEEAILVYVQEQGSIARREAAELCGLTEKQAEYRLSKLVEAGELQLVGKGRGAHYVMPGQKNSA